MSAGAAKTAWAAVHVVLAFGGRRAAKKPSCAHRLRKDATVATSSVEMADSTMEHFAAIEGAKLCAHRYYY